MPPKLNPPSQPGIHAVIMAGGSGTRFWPMSRRSLPKQFLPLCGEQSLLRQTFERLEPIAGAERTWVITHESHVHRVLSEIPEVRKEQVIGEPVGRNTAPCIGLAARRIARDEPHAGLLICPADHVIRPPEAFAAVTRTALEVLSSCDSADDPLTVTFGIVARSPATGFGYIERGDAWSRAAIEGRVYRALRFREKPSLSVAREFLASGRFYWNSGIFLWRAAGVLKLIERHIPELATGLERIERLAGGPGGLPAALRTCFGALPSISIDYGVLEHTRNVAVVEAAFDWDDVGSWAAVDRYAPQDAAGNSVLSRHLGLDTQRCIIVGKKRLVATLGVEDLVIVDTDDAVLICRRDQTERVKELVDRLGQEGMEELL